MKRQTLEIVFYMQHPLTEDQLYDFLRSYTTIGLTKTNGSVNMSDHDGIPVISFEATSMRHANTTFEKCIKWNYSLSLETLTKTKSFRLGNNAYTEQYRQKIVIKTLCPKEFTSKEYDMDKTVDLIMHRTMIGNLLCRLSEAAQHNSVLYELLNSALVEYKNGNRQRYPLPKSNEKEA